MAKRYTKDGQQMYKAGDKVEGKYCVSEAWLARNGYYEYVTKAEDGEDGVVDGKWVHYTGAPYVAPEPEPVPVPEKTAEELLAEAKLQKLMQIEAYDTSSAVNGFTYQGQEFWLPRETRVSLMNTANILDSETMVLWFGTFSIELPVEQVKAMLSALEKYAFACYNITASHKAAVSEIGTVDEVNAYDITSGYPEKLAF